MRIYTPNDYALFKRGLLGEDNDQIILHYEAHRDPHIFAYAKFYSTSRFHTVKMCDKLGGYMRISPGYKKCYAHIVEYDNHFPDMAENCHEYDIYIQNDYNSTTADADAILRWQSAKSIWLHGKGNRIAFELTQRIDELKTMDLEQLHLPIERQMVKQLNTTIFLESLTHLRWLTLYKGDVDASDFAEFVETQPSTDLFRKEMYDGRIEFFRIVEEIESVQYVEHYDRITISYYNISYVNNQTQLSYTKREIVNRFGCDLSDKSVYKTNGDHGFSTSSLNRLC